MRRVAALVVLLALALPGAALAQDSADRVATRVSQEIMSPFCDGVTLHDCPSKEADELRLEIASWARAGMTQAEIIARLEERYGSVISGTPGNPLAWVIPLGVAIAGVALVLALGRRFSRPRAGDRDPSLPAITGADRARVDAEIRAFRERNGWSG